MEGSGKDKSKGEDVMNMIIVTHKGKYRAS